MRDLVTSNGEKAYCTVKFRGINQTMELIFDVSPLRITPKVEPSAPPTAAVNQTGPLSFIRISHPERKNKVPLSTRVELHRTASCFFFFFCLKM